MILQKSFLFGSQESLSMLMCVYLLCI